MRQYRLTVIFKAEDDGEADIAAEKTTDALRRYNFPIIYQTFESSSSGPYSDPSCPPDTDNH
jgi:hypothetical protein